jgi:4-hydroxy-3-methylbut-2-enyl diphosphate reductase
MISYGDEKTRVVQADTDFGTEVWDTLCIVCQTTQKISDLQTLVTRLLPKVKELRVFNTICRATSERQQSAQALAESSDLMVVIGGKNSANTRMLQQLCQTITHSVHIENETELTPDLLTDYARIGLVAGASTPADTILAVYNKIMKIIGNTEAATRFEEIPLFKEESC